MYDSRCQFCALLFLCFFIPSFHVCWPYHDLEIKALGVNKGSKNAVTYNGMGPKVMSGPSKDSNDFLVGTIMIVCFWVLEYN